MAEMYCEALRALRKVRVLWRAFVPLHNSLSREVQRDRERFLLSFRRTVLV